MNFICQNASIEELNMLAAGDRHSVLIEGPEGSGKTFLARKYASMLQVPDFQEISPKVDTIKEAIDTCMQIATPIVLCIENLDCGVPAASYTLLKFLEEPLPNVYIVVTCKNLKNIPDTIVSRSVVVSTAPPVDMDISNYAISRDIEKFKQLQQTRLWKCVRTFKDADIVLGMDAEQIKYFTDLESIAKFRDTVSNLVWQIGHYPNNSETPVELVIRYLIELCNTAHIRQAGISCISDLTQGRVAAHAAIAKFVFVCKYCE